MSDRRTAYLEQLVEEFVERRASEPTLSAEEFAAEHRDAPEGLLVSLRACLDVIGALHEDVELLPDAIGPYRIVRELGRGGMGVVYEAERDGRAFALKRLSITAMLQPRAVQRFQREATALQRIEHPGIVAVHDVGSADGLPYLVMELVDGRSLADSDKLPWRRAVEIVRDVALALAPVHAAGLCHRDLKPQNILLRTDGTPVIVDFGLVHDDADDTLTATGDLIGTPRYLAPEQAEGRSADARTDVHALGLVLAEILSQKPLRCGADRTTLMKDAVRGLRRRDIVCPSGAPRGLVRVIQIAAARVPRDRYPDAGALARDLDRVLAGRPVRTAAPGVQASLRDAVRFHPRAVSCALGLTLAVVVTSTLVWQHASAVAASTRADASFEEALLAWLHDDTASTRLALADTVRDQPQHRDAIGLLAVIDAAAIENLREGEALHDGIRQRLDQRWPLAAATFRTAAERDPKSAFARILLAEAEEHCGRLTIADSELTTASRLLPGSAPLAVALAGLRQRRGDYRAAAAEFRRAIALKQDSFDLNYQLARCCEHFDAEAALAALDAAKGLTPPRGDKDLQNAGNLRGALLDKLGRTEEAVTLLTELADSYPRNVGVLFNLGYALDRQLRIADAKPRYEQVLQLDPGNLKAAMCLSWLLTTAKDESLRDLGRAELLLLRALRQDRGLTPSVLQMMREFGLRTGRIDKLTAELGRLAQDREIQQEQRVRLLHTRNYLQNGAPSGR